MFKNKYQRVINRFLQLIKKIKFIVVTPTRIEMLYVIVKTALYLFCFISFSIANPDAEATANKRVVNKRVVNKGRYIKLLEIVKNHEEDISSFDHN